MEEADEEENRGEEEDGGEEDSGRMGRAGEDSDGHSDVHEALARAA